MISSGTSKIERAIRKIVNLSDDVELAYEDKDGNNVILSPDLPNDFELYVLANKEAKTTTPAKNDDVKMNFQSTIVIIVETNAAKSETVGKLKEIINNEMGVEKEVQRLYLKDKLLEDKTPLSAYEIPEGSNLKLSIYRKTSDLTYKVFLITLTGETVEYEVGACDTILSLKEKIFEKQGLYINSQRLIFAGKQLEDGKTFSDYNEQLILVLEELDCFALSERGA